MPLSRRHLPSFPSPVLAATPLGRRHPCGRLALPRHMPPRALHRRSDRRQAGAGAPHAPLLLLLMVGLISFPSYFSTHGNRSIGAPDLGVQQEEKGERRKLSWKGTNFCCS